MEHSLQHRLKASARCRPRVWLHALPPPVERGTFEAVFFHSCRWLVLVIVCGVAGDAYGRDPSEPLIGANLEMLGNGRKEILREDGTQRFDYTCQLSLQFECEFVATSDDVSHYVLSAVVGELTLSGTATFERGDGESTDIVPVAERIELDSAINGSLLYDQARSRIQQLEIDISALGELLQVYSIRFHSVASGHFLRVLAELPEEWWFDDVYDFCHYSVDFDRQIIQPEGLALTEVNGFFFESAHGGHGVLSLPGHYVELEFTLDEAYESAELWVQHAAAESASCLERGASIEVEINGESIDGCSEPPRFAEEQSGFSLTTWDVSRHLQAGVNTARVTLCEDSCAEYWLRHLHFVVDTPRCASAWPVFAPPVGFLRGDANDDGLIDLSDAAVLLDLLFGGGPPLACADSGDGNDDGFLDVSDVLSVLLAMFGERELPAPVNCCGDDPSDDGIECDSYVSCPR